MSKNFKNLLFHIAILLMMLLYTGFTFLGGSMTPIESITTMLLCCFLSVIFTYMYIAYLLKSFKNWWKE